MADYPSFSAVRQARLQRLRRRARERAVAVLDRLAELGVEAAVTGSLATGRFDEASDVDFLVLSLSKPELRYCIEDAMGSIPFDVVYLDEVKSQHLRRKLTEKARDRADLAGY